MFERLTLTGPTLSRRGCLGNGTFLLILWIVFSYCLGSPLYGQAASASISGYVSDQNNAAVPGVIARITNLDTQIATTAKTGATGLYVFPSLQPGSYEIKVSREGFRDTVVPHLSLGVQENISRDFVLTIGSATQTVTVNADPAAVLVQSTSSEFGTVVGEKQIQELPLDGRHFTELLSLTPGAIPVSTAQSAGIGVSDLANLAPPSAEIAQPTIGGQFNRSNLYMPDGVVNTELNTSAHHPSHTAIRQTTSCARLTFRTQISQSSRLSHLGRQPPSLFERRLSTFSTFRITECLIAGSGIQTRG
jgi:hypothetical protein